MREGPAISPLVAGARVLPLLMVALYAVVLARTAWLSDDAYITFRTIDNVLNGHGLTWNPGERVQAFTHPLWMLLLTTVAAVTRDLFFTSIVVSIAASLIAAALLAGRLAASPMTAVLALGILVSSKAFVDYSTSGLENPLTHLLLVAFWLLYLGRPLTSRTLFWLTLVAGLAVLNRTDTLLIYLPALAYGLWRLRGRRTLGLMAAALAPLFLWELFSLIYYGALVPNTAYAKLNTGISQFDLFTQGLLYLLNSLDLDPLTLLVIASGLALPVVTRDWKSLPVALGIALYLLYILRIGGDFMSGRFLAAPLLCAVVLVARLPLKTLEAGVAVVVALGLGLISPRSPLLSDASYGSDLSTVIDARGISDERAGYYQTSGLLTWRRNVAFPATPWAEEGRAARAESPRVVVRRHIGFFGYFAGPDVHIIDSNALSDPLLARMPAIRAYNWRIGHFERHVPDGYVDSIIAGRTLIADPALAALHDQITLLTRGPLFSPERLRAIVALNLGRWDAGIDTRVWTSPEKRRALAAVEEPRPADTPLDVVGNRALPPGGLWVTLPTRAHAPRIEVSVGSNLEGYALAFYDGEEEIGQATFAVTPSAPARLVVVAVAAPAVAVERGYTEVRLFPVERAGVPDENHGVMGHLRLLAP